MMISDRAALRIMEIATYIEKMEVERQGWGLTAMNDVNDTARSFARAMGNLVTADEVWIDGGTGYSFGGVIGGMQFGMIARQRVTDERFTTQPIEWTFHS